MAAWFGKTRSVRQDDGGSQRIQAQILYTARFKFQEISTQTGLTFRQIQYAVTHGCTPAKRKDRPTR